MTKVEVFDEINKPQEVVRLRLVQDGDCVFLIAVNAYGNRLANLIRVNPDCSITHCRNVRVDGVKTEDTCLIVRPA